MALNSRVLSKNDKNEDVSNAKDMGMMSNNTNLAQILATSVNGFLLDYFKEYAHRACLFDFCASGLTGQTQSQAPHGRQANQLRGRVRNWYRLSPPRRPPYLARAWCSIAVVMGPSPCEGRVSSGLK
jgi:hypothetical protein